MKNFSLRRLALPARSLDVWLLLLLLAAATPAIVFRHQSLFLAPRLDLLDHSWLLDTSYKAATGVWFGRDVAFTYGPFFQWLSSAPSRWLGLSTGTVFATWFTLPLFLAIVATFLSGRLLFPPEQCWRRALFLVLAVVFWSVPDVRASISLLAFLIFVRLLDAVASSSRTVVLPAVAAAAICLGCFLLSADSGIYSVAALLLTVAATGTVLWGVTRVLFRLINFLFLAAVCFVVLMLVTNGLMKSPLNFSFWHSSLAIATSYRWFEALGMPRPDKHRLFVTLAASIIVFLLGWIWREPHSRRWTLRPAFLFSGFCFALLMMQSGVARSDPGHVLLAIFPMVFLGGAILVAGRSSAPVTSAVTLGTTVILTLMLGHAYWTFVPYSLMVKGKEIAHPLLSCPEEYRWFDRGCFRNSDAALLSRVSGYVDQHTANGDSILVFPYETAFGLTSRRRVAGGVLQSYLASGEYLNDLELSGLRRANPPAGLYLPDGVISKGVDEIPNFTRNPELWFYLLRHYRSDGTPADGVVALARDESRDWRLRFSSQSLVRSYADMPITKRNTWLNLGPLRSPESEADFLRIRMRVSYSPLWRMRKPSRTVLQITFADGSQKLLPFLVEPNRTSEVWLYPWNETEMGNFFAPDELQWRSSNRSPITSLQLFVTRYDWISVVPSRVLIEEIDGVRISMSPVEQPATSEDQ
jgi:hypothetical protein